MAAKKAPAWYRDQTVVTMSDPDSGTATIFSEYMPSTSRSAVEEKQNIVIVTAR